MSGVFEGGEIEAGQDGLKRGDGLQVIGFLGLAHVDDAERCVGQRGLHDEDVLRVLLCLLGRAAGQGQHFGEVGDVLFADLDVLVAGAQVIVLLGQAQAALLDEGDLLGCVFQVLLLAVAEEDVDAFALQLADQGGKLDSASRAVVEGVDLIEQGPDGLEAGGVDGVGVHAGLEVVADLLLVGRACGAAGLSLFEDGV